MVAAIIEEKKDEIAALCRDYRVVRLDLFGSAATDRFEPESSDIDFLVDLGEYEGSVVYRYLDFADALEALLGRSVDLVTVRSVKSPLFRQSLEKSRITLYVRDSDRDAA